MTRNPTQIVTLTAALQIVTLAVALGLLCIVAMGQTTTAPQSGAEQGYNATDDSTDKPGKHADEMGKAMKGMTAKLSDDMKMRCQMQMDMEVSPSDPSAILALRDQLQLTTGQATELQAISKEARDNAFAVLNADQQKTLGTLPQESQTMKGMHRQMIDRLQTTHDPKVSNPQMNCPVMQMMQDSTESTVQPIAGTPVAAPTYTKPVIDPKASTGAMNAAEANTVKATSLLSKLRQYTTDNKTDLAEKTLDQLDGMKGSLPASLQSQIETARTALKAKQAAALYQ